MLNCIAIDDEPLSLDVLRSYMQNMTEVSLAKSFTSARKAKEYLNEHPVDLIFLDIEMPDTDGLSFYRSLKHPPGVIFITAYSNYAVEGFAVDAIDYLLKPIDPDRLQEAVFRALSRIQHTINNIPDTYMRVRCNYQMKTIYFTDILYIECLNDYVKFFLEKEQKPVLTLLSMKEVMAKLPEFRFIRIHRSYIIPVNRITSYNSRYIHLNNISLPIGETYRESIRQTLQK
ncbi:two component transcriptional regulator, LytTR family [Filimonas lacunae]|uniref:Two component transcriptional regulator, LytTR family n=1 Tax=Filimonas lacunae TaxID=477680 RepID=A0A173MG89_9BACT|nr:response regulator transcription factor [Filimonas lacunae]BAV06438.1 two-component system response regulator [Filimonas lacunae]SIT26960.1 two component transcriptional regulator, LytTR family [Filimonas lacunae]